MEELEDILVVLQKNYMLKIKLREQNMNIKWDATFLILFTIFLLLLL